jgi:formylglycine-generating enzyme required for sulfatase activity
VAEQRPWVGNATAGDAKRLEWQTAKDACEAIGAHLITNAEWMAIARDIESVDSNKNASGVYNSGITSGSASQAAGSEGTGTAKRTHTLSNGQVICDIAGNVWEWVDYKIQSQAGIKPTENAWGYREINTITDWGATNLKYTEVGARDNDLTGGDNGIGKIYYKSADSSEKAFVRGGYWNIGANTGVFALGLNYSPSGSNTNLGFRCAR